MEAAAGAGGGAAPLSAEQAAAESALSPRAAGELAPLTRDTPFKRAFGTKESVATLQHLLNSVLRGPAGAVQVAAIENVEVKSFQLRSVIFDVRCKLTNNDKVIIELQKAEMREEIVDRMIGYQAREYAEQWLPGGRTEAEGGGYHLVPVRVLALLDFLMDKDKAKCGTLVQHYHIQHDASDLTQVPGPAVAGRLKALSDITIVQLPLAPKELAADTPDVGKWAHLLHYTTRYKYEELPLALRKETCQHRFFEKAAFSARYDRMEKWEREALAAEETSLREFSSLDRKLERERILKERAEAQAAAAEAQAAAAEALLAKEREDAATAAAAAAALLAKEREDAAAAAAAAAALLAKEREEAAALHEELRAAKRAKSDAPA